MIHIVLLSGGSGTRLWPLSNESRSKQFLKVLRDDLGRPESMVQRTFRKISECGVDASITVATGESQMYSIQRQIEGNYKLVVEPERRDTAPAIMLACANLFWKQDASKSDTVIVMPIDTYTEDSYYEKLNEVNAAVQENVGDIVLLGVEPTFASTKYGYIVPEASKENPRRVVRFVEKPEKALAQDLTRKGALWNCGVFGFKLAYVMDIALSYGDFTSFEDMRMRYDELPKNSFDYEVLENTQSITVIPCSVKWKDLGTWNTLTEEMVENFSGRMAVDENTCENIHAINETNLPMVLAGVRDAVVVATPDGILVSGKKESAYIKDLVKSSAATRPMYEQRRWGEYRVIDSSVFPDGSKALTKEIVIHSGKQMSYQLHHQRDEIWTVVSGCGEVVLGDLVQKVYAGSVVKIPAGQLHSGRAFSDLHVIEVQTGDVLVEDDIERFGDYWK